MSEVLLQTSQNHKHCDDTPPLGMFTVPRLKMTFKLGKFAVKPNYNLLESNPVAIIVIKYNLTQNHGTILNTQRTAC
jgi:hypothetical protein